MSSVVPARSKRLAIVVGFLLPLAHAGYASAQGTGGAAPGGGAPGGGVPSGGTVTGSTTTTVQGPTTIQNYPGGVAPLGPGQTLGGGNVQYSSSRPITGSGDRDTFDFKPGTATSTVRGGENSSFVLGNGGVSGSASTPGVHVVRKGDTLWGICDGYFRNPYQWPRIWSYNPQIQNPHWIYPGDQVRLRGAELGALVAPTTPTGPGIIDRRRQVPPGTIFLRNEGFIEDDKNTNWGEISGSPEDKMFLTDLDEAYLRVAGDHDVKIGQELTVYRPIKSVAGGKLIEIQGTVKVDQWNPKERVARAQVTESLDTIERGARIAPIQRRFEVVPPARNEADADTTILSSIVPHVFYGQNQIVFLDKGEEAGLKPGNRLFVLKKGDAWHQSLTTKSSAKRIALEDQSAAATESVPKPRSDEALPEEFQAELRVINVKKKTSMAIVTISRREIEQGDKAYLRKGY